MDLGQLTDVDVYPLSVTHFEGETFFLARGPRGKVLGIVGDAAAFEGEQCGDVFLGPMSPANARVLRGKLPWLRPQPLGLGRSAGCGDRLGLATPGHIRALRQVGGGIAAILAQQSMRENARSGRTPQQVVDDAAWGVFQEGWRDPWGADADHLKTTEDVDVCVAAGYTRYTVDPGDHVDNAAHSADRDTLELKFRALPWGDLEDSAAARRGRFLGRETLIEGHRLAFDETALQRAACKYDWAILHTVRMYRHLTAALDGRAASPEDEPAFELEVSVDETDTPTSPLEHVYVATELRRLGVHFVSLAPRYIGRFEKGVDYIGDLEAFETEFAQHAAIARVLGPYTLSIHSGSDKFSIYPIVARHAGELIHLKTAGTSYLEALRAVAAVDPGLFRRILDFARERYGEDRAAYVVSGDAAKVLPGEEVADPDLAGLLNTFDGRQVLHVTYGSVLARFGEQVRAMLDANEEAHYAVLQAHIEKHLLPFK
jgi:hypothetical protein